MVLFAGLESNNIHAWRIPRRDVSKCDPVHLGRGLLRSAKKERGGAQPGIMQSILRS
jgi:hypothetical protein